MAGNGYEGSFDYCNILIIIACIPSSFSILGLMSGVFGVGFSIVAVVLCAVFGFWILTFAIYAGAIVMIVLGIVQLFTIPGAGLIYMGIGSFLIGIGII